MSLHHLVTGWARRTPDALAVSDMDTAFTYRELDQRANDYVTALRGRGVRAGDRVLVWTAKTVEAVALAQAVLRIGAIQVPVARGNPRERVSRIAADAEPALIVTDHDDPFPDAKSVTRAALLDEAEPGAIPEHDPVRLSDPAYILYTSGSTGKPKGVCVSHGSALAFVEWASGELGLTGADRLANHAPFSFDLSVFDLYAAFHAGASVHLIGETLAHAAEQLVDFILGRAITVWYSVPSALILMTEYGDLLGRGPGALRACVFAGETYPLKQLQSLRRAWPGVRMLNWYGPTETNVCTSYEVTAADLTRTTPIPIGSPVAGDRVTVDDGEIVVDGPTVMIGYWGAEPLQGPYRTGDLGRYDADGLLEYRGRRDNLAKVRGYRVEPAEVDAALVTHEGVRDAVVLVLGNGLQARLHAFVVAEPGAEPGLIDLKRHCAARLPSYLNIDALHLIDGFPRTGNGKVDRVALGDLVSPGDRTARGSARA
ncbi:AMP-binding protein [Amycolatopsis pigmentata]|uniref:AMP-binding protein n=1 Tax=Amycolatopsis pigmentata TaxID=450801 RepID=A0ABW5FLH7_9PSEU